MSKPSIVILNIDSFKYNFASEIFQKIANNEIKLCSWKNLINESVLFNNIIATAPYTITSDNSLITGLYPFSHGQTSWMNQAFDSISKHTPTLQWILRSIGYTTYFYSDNLSRVEVAPWNFDFYKKRKISEMFEDISLNISQNSSKPFFYFLKINQIHDAVSKNDGKLTIRDYKKVCIETLLNLENIVKVLSDNSKNIMTYITTDHGTTLSDEPQGRYIEKITGNHLTNKTIRTFLLLKDRNNKIKKASIKKGDLFTNNNLFSNIDIFSTLLNDISINCESHPSKIINGLKEKKRLLSIAGGLLQSPYRESSYSITTNKYRYVSYRRSILGIKYYFYELFNLISDPCQNSNLWENLTKKNKYIIKTNFKKYFSKKDNIQELKNYKFYYGEDLLKLKKINISKDCRFWIFYSRINSFKSWLKILQARMKDRLIYFFRIGNNKFY